MFELLRGRPRRFAALALVASVAGGCRSIPIEPRVIQSNGAIVRLAGPSALEPEQPAVLAYTSLTDVGRARANAERPGLYPDPQPLLWHGDRLTLVDEGPTLRVSGPSGVILRISLNGLPNLREVYGATPSLDGTGEWLALLLHFRATSRREMLVVYNPAGVLVHQEVLQRTIPTPSPLMWTSGPSNARQELGVNLGQRHRFGVPMN